MNLMDTTEFYAVAIGRDDYEITVGSSRRREDAEALQRELGYGTIVVVPVNLTIGLEAA
jgi:hypothetical protein